MEFDEFGNPVNRVQLVEETSFQASAENVPLIIETQETSKNDSVLQAKRKKVQNGHYYNKPPRYTFDKEYLSQIGTLPERVRNFGVVGPYKSGKTMLASYMLLKHYRHHHNVVESMSSVNYYLDNLKIEIERCSSTKLNGGKFLGQDFDEKTWYCNLIDFPGHVDFWDELSVGLQICDTFCIVIDCCEGVTSIVQKLYWNLKQHNKKVIFVINKLDRLILEMRLDPISTYLKLKSIVDDINSIAHHEYYSPEENNVLFASGKLNFVFSLKEFVQKFYFTGLNRSSENLESFTKRMWGDVSYQDGKFSNKVKNGQVPTFIEFILTPLYKIITHTLTLSPTDLTAWLLKNFKIQYKQPNNNEFIIHLKTVFQHIFESTDGFVDSMINATSEPKNAQSITFTEKSPTTVAHILKTIDYCGELWSLVKVHRGTIEKNAEYFIMDSQTDIDADLDDDDDFSTELQSVKIVDMATMGGRFVEPIHAAYAQQLVLVKGLHSHVSKSGTLFSLDFSQTLSKENLFNFEPIPLINESICKIVLQPYHPRELPQLVNALNLVNKLYPNCVVKVENSGEQTLFGSGELYLDTMLYDLRSIYTESRIEIKSTANPITSFKEGVLKESFASIPIRSKNFEISITAAPLGSDLIQDITSHNFDPVAFMNSGRHVNFSRALRNEYAWDIPSSKNCWAFENTNCFINDTLPEEVDQNLLIDQYKTSIIQGFKWCCKEGPLAEEPLRGVQFRLIKLEKLEESVKVNLGELVPLVRKACFVAILTANPILYEPVYEIDVITKKAYQDIVKNSLRKRRGGKFHKETLIPGTPLVELRGQIPVIDSYGVEVDIKMGCNGSAIVQQHTEFHIWRKVPGDVMDYNCSLPKLEPVPYESLSRDFVLKTRRRKGLDSDSAAANPEDDGPSLKKYIDMELFTKIKQAGLI